MVQLAVYDTETSALLRRGDGKAGEDDADAPPIAFGQIFQFYARILRDEPTRLVPGRSMGEALLIRRMPHVVPMPMALKTNRLMLSDLEGPGTQTQFEAARRFVEFMDQATDPQKPVLMAGHNIDGFDKHYLWQFLQQSLFDPYRFQKGGQIDTLSAIRVADAVAPGSFRVPVIDGKKSFRQEKLIEAFWEESGPKLPDEVAAEIAHRRLKPGQAHDAQYDVERGAVPLLLLLKARAGFVYRKMLLHATRHGVLQTLRSSEHGLFYKIGARFNEKSTWVMPLLSSIPDNARYVPCLLPSAESVAALRRIQVLSGQERVEALAAFYQTRGEAQLIATNRAPFLMHECDAKAQGYGAQGYGKSTAAETFRAADEARLLLKQDPALQRDLHAAVKLAYPEPVLREDATAEERLFGQFLSNRDRQLCQQFHETADWHRRADIMRQFSGPEARRMRQFALRVIGEKALFNPEHAGKIAPGFSGVLSAEEEVHYAAFVINRILSPETARWPTLALARKELQKMREEQTGDDAWLQGLEKDYATIEERACRVLEGVCHRYPAIARRILIDNPKQAGTPAARVASLKLGFPLPPMPASQPLDTRRPAAE